MMQIVEDRALLVRTDDPEPILSRIKRSKHLGNEVAVHWGLSEVRALAEAGYVNVPSPILRDYKWTGKLKPFDHQKVTSSFLTLYDRAFCFSEQGTAKTASVIWASDYLLDLGEIQRVLVICPLSVMKCAWQNDLFKFAMHRSSVTAHGTAKVRQKAIASNAEFVIINFDGVATVMNEIIAGGFDLIVVDEANAYKNAQTNRWKVLSKILAATRAKLWMLTGTPAAQSPMDAFGLARLVNPDECPRYYGAFRDKVMWRISQFKWLPKPGSEDYVHDILQPAIRFERKDCLDLPDVIHVEREAPMTRMQKNHYDLLRKNMAMDAAGERITATTAANNLNKLLQIAGGAVYTDDGEVVQFDVSTRVNTILEVIEEASHKVLIFVPFTHTIDVLSEAFTKHKVSHEIIDGRVPANSRGDIVHRFQTKKDPHVLILQPQAAAHGITLTAADTIIWYSPITSVETYLQGNARINRPGQKNAMQIVHISGSPVEERLYTLLQGNIKNHEKLIELYQAALTL